MFLCSISAAWWCNYLCSSFSYFYLQCQWSMQSHKESNSTICILVTAARFFYAATKFISTWIYVYTRQVSNPRSQVLTSLRDAVQCYHSSWKQSLNSVFLAVEVESRKYDAMIHTMVGGGWSYGASITKNCLYNF